MSAAGRLAEIEARANRASAMEVDWDRLDDAIIRDTYVGALLASVEPVPALIAALRAVLHEHRPMRPLSNPDPTPNCWTCDEPSPCGTVAAISAALAREATS